MTAVESERTAQPPSDQTQLNRDVAVALRSCVLALTPADIEIHRERIANSVWGVLIETAHPDAVATLVVLADGSVSLYVSDGNGCVGCGADQEVRFAGADLLEIANQVVAVAAPTEDRGYPPSGTVRFYFLSFEGLRSSQLRLEELSLIDAQFSLLYFAGQRVINAIERVGAGQSLAREIRFALQSPSSPPAKGSRSCLSVGNAVRRLLP